MNVIDDKIITFVNQFARQSWAIDNGIAFLAGNQLLKGGVLMAIVWWAWFKNEDRHPHHREKIIATLVSCLAAVLLARALALTLPFRLRPIHNGEIRFLLPHGILPIHFDGWSAFPSDHAVLFFALSTGIVFVSRQAGLVTFFYTAVFIAFPRVYLGLHYPTDIIAGAVMGVMIALAGNHCLAGNRSIQFVTTLSRSRPELFYPLFFLFTYQIADMFDSIRSLGQGLLTLLKSMIA